MGEKRVGFSVLLLYLATNCRWNCAGFSDCFDRLGSASLLGGVAGFVEFAEMTRATSLVAEFLFAILGWARIEDAITVGGRVNKTS